jgi:hypothetical protein
MKLIFILFLTAFVSPFLSAQLTVGYDVPCPKAYEVRYTRDGRRYILVREFERRQTDTVTVAPRTVGVVTTVTQNRSGAAHVTLRAGNGLTFGVRTGDTFTFSGRSFKAIGFVGNRYHVRCPRTGQSFYFRR